MINKFIFKKNPDYNGRGFLFCKFAPTVSYYASSI